MHFLARNRSSHRDARNRAVHLVATVVGFCCLVSMLARLHVPGHAAWNAGTALGVITVAYYAPIEPLATAIVAAAWLGMGLVLGPSYGQAGAPPLLGELVPLGVFLAFNLTGVWTHRIFKDAIIDPHSVEPVWKRLLKTAHTILFSSVQFVTFALLDLGYRPALKARLLEHTRAYSMCRPLVPWTNWGRTAACTPAMSYFPENEQDLVQIVRDAAAQGRRVRAVAQGYSWPNLSSTSDVLVFVTRLDRIEVDTSDPENPRVVVEAGATNGAVNEQLALHGLTLPFNVVLESVRVGGTIAVGAHGSGHKYPTLSDLVESIEVVTAGGEIRRFSEETDGPEVMNAVRLHLGLFGLVWRMTLRVTKNFRVRQIDRLLPVETALCDVKALVARHHAVDLFFWPFCSRVWVKTQDRTDAPREAAPRSSALRTFNHHLVAKIFGALAWVPRTFPRATPWLCRLAFRFAPAKNDVVVDVVEAVHFRKAVDAMRVTCQEFAFKVDTDFDNVRTACRAVFERLDAWAARGQYPFNLTLNLRFVAESSALMSPGNGPGLNCYVEILSQYGTPGWKEFASEVAREWMKLPEARPHWAKEWEHIPGIVGYLREAYGEQMQRFLDIREASGVDPTHMFSNRLMDALFFAPVPGDVAGLSAADPEARVDSDDEEAPSMPAFVAG
jgi:hypothetical protein